ncbi:hypothetical protein [Aquidulcibacter sp.]|uniref:hypothetical protein n=1 Tax=Aquidulcibacter sp. TaxID=2052990 RepID=UPI0025B89B56|nr:hypothetical protein [Aquidulcibacter sp.]MCA3694643.1 hypothetical protein [Aquidulcibacter sp.]
MLWPFCWVGCPVTRVLSTVIADGADDPGSQVAKSNVIPALRFAPAGMTLFQELLLFNGTGIVGRIL